MVKNMIEKENFIFKLKPDRLNFIIYYFFAVLIFIFNLIYQKNIFLSFFISFLIILFVEIYRLSLTYYFYSDRLVKIFKFVTVNELVVYYEKIQDLSISQNILERILNIGKIHVNTAGSDKVEMVLEGIKKPNEVKEKVLNLINKV